VRVRSTRTFTRRPFRDEGSDYVAQPTPLTAQHVGGDPARARSTKRPMAAATSAHVGQIARHGPGCRKRGSRLGLPASIAASCCAQPGIGIAASVPARVPEKRAVRTTRKPVLRRVRAASVVGRRVPSTSVRLTGRERRVPRALPSVAPPSAIRRPRCADDEHACLGCRGGTALDQVPGAEFTLLASVSRGSRTSGPRCSGRQGGRARRVFDGKPRSPRMGSSRSAMWPMRRVQERHSGPTPEPTPSTRGSGAGWRVSRGGPPTNPVTPGTSTGSSSWRVSR